MYIIDDDLQSLCLCKHRLNILIRCVTTSCYSLESDMTCSVTSIQLLWCIFVHFAARTNKGLKNLIFYKANVLQIFLLNLCHYFQANSSTS